MPNEAMDPAMVHSPDRVQATYRLMVVQRPGNRHGAHVFAWVQRLGSGRNLGRIREALQRKPEVRQVRHSLEIWHGRSLTAAGILLVVLGLPSSTIIA